MDRDDKSKQLIMDFQNVFTSESGKRVLEALRKEAKSETVNIPLDANGKIDVYRVMVYGGQRSMIVHIDSILAKNPNVIKQEIAKG